MATWYHDVKKNEKAYFNLKYTFSNSEAQSKSIQTVFIQVPHTTLKRNFYEY